MEQKITKTAYLFRKRKATRRRRPLLKLLTCVGIILVGSSFTACEKKVLNSETYNVFPAFSNKVILDWNAAVFSALDAPNY